MSVGMPVWLEIGGRGPQKGLRHKEEAPNST